MKFVGRTIINCNVPKYCPLADQFTACEVIVFNDGGSYRPYCHKHFLAEKSDREQIQAFRSAGMMGNFE